MPCTTRASTKRKFNGVFVQAADHDAELVELAEFAEQSKVDSALLCTEALDGEPAAVREASPSRMADAALSRASAEVAQLCLHAPEPMSPASFRPRCRKELDLGEEHEVAWTVSNAKMRNQLLRPNPRYLTEVQTDGLEESHRALVMDWNIELVETLGMSNETLLLGFNFLDRVLSDRSMPKEELQVTSMSCMWVASKVCDGPIPTATRLAGFAGVTKKQIVKTEHAVLGDLDWNLQSVTVYHYVHLLMPYLEDPTEKLKMYSEHVAVAQALSYQFLHYEPSTLAVATICVAAELVHEQSGRHEEVLKHLCSVADVDVTVALKCVKLLEEHIRKNLVMTGPMSDCEQPAQKARAAESPTNVNQAAAQLSPWPSAVPPTKR